MKKTDVIIIGAGISGLTASIYLKRANIDFIVLESTLPGGMLNSLKKVDNYPGFPPCSGQDILLGLLKQIKVLSIEITYGDVQTVLKDEYGFKVVSDKDIYYAKAVVVATGANKQSKLIKGEKEFFGRGVSYCATCDGAFFKDLDVLVYGNNSVAIEEAIYLTNIVHKLYFVVDGEKLVGDQKLLSTLSNSKNVEFIYDSLDEIKGDMLGVNQVVLSSKRVLNVSGVFPYVGEKNAIEFLKSLNPTLVNNFIKTDENMASDILGLFAIGDVRDKALRQLVTASSDGAIVSTSLITYLKSLNK